MNSILATPTIDQSAHAAYSFLETVGFTPMRANDCFFCCERATETRDDAMSHIWLTIDQVAKQLGRDRRELEKLAAKGRMPGRRVGDTWQFHPTEITHWIEQEMRGFSEGDLADLEASQDATETDAEIPLSNLLKPELIEIPLQARTKPSVLSALIRVAGQTWHVWEPDKILAAVQEREQAHTTAFDNGVAIPHPRNPQPETLGESVVAFGRTYSGIPFGAPNNSLSDLFFLVLCRDTPTHLRVLARLGRLMQRDGFVDGLREIESPQETYDFILEHEQQLQPGR